MRKFDLLTIQEETASFKTLNGKLLSGLQSHFTKKGLRKNHDGCLYYFNYWGAVSDEEFIDRSKILRGTGLTLDYELVPWQNHLFVEEKSQSLSLANLESEVLAVEEQLGPLRDNFNVQGVYHRTRQKVTLTDDQGQCLQAHFTTNNIWYSITRKASASIMDGYFVNERLGLSSDYVVLSLQRMLEKYDQPVAIADGEYPILFAMGSGAEEMLLTKIKSSLLADSYFQDAGLLSGKLGAKVFSTELSVVDTNQLVELGIYAPFDMEGTIRERPALTLIEKGVVKNLIADLRLAKKYQLQPTGNSSRNYQSTTTTDYHGVTILPGAKSTQEILQSLSVCLVVMMSFGGDFTDLGDFSTPVQLCYLYRYGERMGRLDPITVKSTIQKMFGEDLIAVATDNYFQSAASPSVFCKMQLFNN